ncbi:MAG TPA: thiamine pyrophosphate-binding protein, partial [Anaerolineaceae bacterium]|nr:thiamine pyrophosphate-binding protein [Anaerolineaceae bacterium]
MESMIGIGDYLIEQILAQGVQHVFGVPGDYVLGFFKKMVDSPLQVVNTSDEQGAGFAADAYARLTGLGVVCVTYGVGGLKVVNTTAQAFAEQVPVLVISGAPGTRERVKNQLLHHKSNRFDTQMKIFEQISVATADLSDPDTALLEIDRVIEAVLRYKRPGFIEIPRDMVDYKVARLNKKPGLVKVQSEPETLKEALQETVNKINAAKRPVILMGDECYRFGWHEQSIRFAENTQIPLAVTISGKSAVPETHPLYMGVYAGALGDEAVRDYVETSDCLILVGALLTDVNLGIYSAHLDPSKIIFISNEKITIAHHTYETVTAQDFLQGLLEQEIHPCVFDWKKPVLLSDSYISKTGAKITVQRVFQQINAFLDCNMVVISDVGDALYGAMDLVTCRSAQFLATAYYASLGFAVPASIGAQMSNRDLRPLVLVGDGAFQMTGIELSTAARYNLNPIVVVLNNQGYGTERPILDGPFND